MKADANPSARPVRVLFLARLFGGLKQGLAKGKWEPSGVPAVYRLVEGLAADREIELLSVFSLKEPDERIPRMVKRSVAPIGNVNILPFRGGSSGWLRSLGTVVTEIEQTIRIIVAAARFRPDIVYSTYASIQAAGLLARLGQTVVLRLMGVVPHHHHIAKGGLPLLGWQLRAPFAQVVSTEDGSDPSSVLPRLLRSPTPWSVRLNGCDAAPVEKSKIEALRSEFGLGEKPVVVFLGRLEPQKGCMQFTDAATAILAQDPDCADFLIVGDGPLRAKIEARVEASGRSKRIRLVGAQPHERAYRFVCAADIYVSTNLYGNISNANLEAIAAGACILMPTSDPEVPIDTVTDRLIPADVACRYDRDRLPDSLAEALSEIIHRPSEISRRRARTAALAKKLIRPWASCVEEDIDVLKSLARTRVSPATKAEIT